MDPFPVWVKGQVPNLQPLPTETTLSVRSRREECAAIWPPTPKTWNKTALRVAISKPTQQVLPRLPLPPNTHRGYERETCCVDFENLLISHSQKWSLPCGGKAGPQRSLSF
jgi:hypothetical protein